MIVVQMEDWSEKVAGAVALARMVLVGLMVQRYLLASIPCLELGFVGPMVPCVPGQYDIGDRS